MGEFARIQFVGMPAIVYPELDKVSMRGRSWLMGPLGSTLHKPETELSAKELRELTLASWILGETNQADYFRTDLEKHPDYKPTSINHRARELATTMMEIDEVELAWRSLAEVMRKIVYDDENHRALTAHIAAKIAKKQETLGITRYVAQPTPKVFALSANSLWLELRDYHVPINEVGFKDNTMLLSSYESFSITHAASEPLTGILEKYKI